MVAPWALAIVSIDLIMAGARGARVRGWAIVDVCAHVVAIFEHLLEAAVAVTLIIVDVDPGWRGEVDALAVTSACLPERSAIMDVQAIHPAAERFVASAMNLVTCIPGGHGIQGVASTAGYGASFGENHRRCLRGRLVSPKGRHPTLQRLASLQGRESASLLAVHVKLVGIDIYTIRTVPIHASVQQLIPEEELPSWAHCVGRSRSGATRHPLAKLQLP
mmetsp:Transcript_15884/g.36255  ORF Transcript_15884/g.36255 Transcript_15884/m.36255 type:complete len:219 (+) Transcript_15884:9598-10254(+)